MHICSALRNVFEELIGAWGCPALVVLGQLPWTRKTSAAAIHLYESLGLAKVLAWCWQRIYMAVCQNLVPLVNIKIAGKWMFIPLKMVLIGIDPYPYLFYIHSIVDFSGNF